MDINYLGHSSFRIKGRNQTVVTDPYDTSIGLKFPKVEADVVTVSHDHFDHNKVESVNGVKKIFTAPGEYEISGTSIFGIPTYHDDKKGELRGKNTIYVIQMDDITIAHLGDLGHTLSEAQLEQIGDVDILLTPVGGEFTIGPSEAVDVVHSIEPKVVIPMHYKVPALNPDFEKLQPVDAFISALGVKSETLPKLSIKSSELPGDEQRVYILEIK